MKQVISAAALCVALASAGAASALPTGEAIDELVAEAMQTFDVPGMGVSVVYDGEVRYSRGHGIVETGGRTPVSDETLFQIGSVSKALTAAALALLVDAGELEWDDAVIDHLPEFRMHDPWVTREFTVRDLLTHRSGLPPGAGDLLIFPDGDATVEEIIRVFRYLEPATSFRSEFAYDNLLYIVAGEIVARLSGATFPEFVEQRLLEPLGMRDCVASPGRAAPDADVATAHMLVDGELATTTTRVTDVVAPAGGITCSARGMARWMQFVLDQGVTAEGERLISEEQFRELVTPVTLLDSPGYLVEHADASLSAYALGWNVSTFYGQPMLSHGGGVWGMTTFLAVLPAEGLAVFATGNQMSVAPRAVVNGIVDAFLADSVAGAGKDWIAILREAARDRGDAAAEAVQAAWDARDAKSTPSLPLAAYAGTYRDPWYGDVRIVLEDGRLWFRSERNAPLQGPLEHFQHDTFVARWSDRRLMADAYVTFTLGHDGAVERIRMQAVSPATDFSYDFHDLDLERVRRD